LKDMNNRKKILLFSRDPGGANTIFPLVGPLKKKGYSVLLYGKDIALKIYSDHGLSGLNIKDFIGHFDKEVVQMPRSALKEGYAFGYAATSMPDRNSLGQDSKSVKEWINSKENLMTFHERLVAGIKYKKEKGEAMDQERQSLYFTICPSSKFERYATGHGLAVGKGGVVELTENFRNPSFGIRRVITKK